MIGIRIKENDLFVVEHGVKRRAEKVLCKVCNKKFIRRIGRKTSRCSRSCFYKTTRHKKTVLECFNCHQKFERLPNKLKGARHGIYFCSRKCKDFAQSLRGNCPKIRPSHYGTTDEYLVKDFYKEHFHKGCLCGEKELSFTNPSCRRKSFQQSIRKFRNRLC